MKDLIIVGASGFGREVLKYVQDINNVKMQWNIKGFIDDNPNALDGIDCGFAVLGNIKDWEPSANEEFVLALAFPQVKKEIVSKLKEKGARFAQLIHPTAIINENSCIGEGTIVSSNCIISSNTHIGDFVTLLSSGVAHDAQIGDFSTLSGRCSINGHVIVGSMVYMGCGVLVAPSKKIGDNATVGIGSVVISNVKAGTKVFGNPAKRIKI